MGGRLPGLYIAGRFKVLQIMVRVGHEFHEFCRIYGVSGAGMRLSASARRLRLSGFRLKWIEQPRGP